MFHLESVMKITFGRLGMLFFLFLLRTSVNLQDLRTSGQPDYVHFEQNALSAEGKKYFQAGLVRIC